MYCNKTDEESGLQASSRRLFQYIQAQISQKSSVPVTDPGSPLLVPQQSSIYFTEWGKDSKKQAEGKSTEKKIPDNFWVGEP